MFYLKKSHLILLNEDVLFDESAKVNPIFKHFMFFYILTNVSTFCENNMPKLYWRI